MTNAKRWRGLAAVLGAIGTALLILGSSGTAHEPASPSAQKDDEAKKKAEEEKKRKEEELDVKGLVLLRKTVKGTTGKVGGGITGTVVNRRPETLKYVQIQFRLYDKSGSQIGTALANTNGLESGGKWNFKATTFGKEFATFKFYELKGH